jgi:prepilin-type N-terminal cleavage/methylation domain-containing protein
VESKNPAKEIDRSIPPNSRPASALTSERCLPRRSVRAKAGRLTSGFTLIELLVVIAIIIILMAFLFPAFRGVQNQAKRAQAKNDLTQIVTAVNAFYTEYGKYPTSATTDATAKYGPGSANTNDVLFNELRAKSAVLNTRQIVFISPPDVKDPANPRAGIGRTTGAGQYYDPWGTPYAIALDADYDNQVTPNPYPDTDGSAGANPLRLGVINWSYGSDGVLGTKSPASSNFKGSDDVISWQ